jgi:hypothetical protein
VSSQPATLTVTTSDIDDGDFVYTHFIAGEGGQAGATVTNTPTLTAPQTDEVTTSGAVSVHRSGYFTAASSNPSVSHQLSGFATPGGNIDRTTAIVVRFRESAPPPDFTIDAVIEPSETVTVVASNYTPAPTAVTLTDSLSNSITLALTSAGGNNYTFEVPALPTLSANNDFVLFGGLTATIGAVSKPTTLQVAGTQTLTTLETGFDDYVFQGWVPQPVAGDQLVTNTAECYFRTDGDLVWPEMTAGVAPIWYVDKTTGTVYGLQVDSTELSTLEYAENLPLLSFGIAPKALTLDVGSSFVSELPLTSFTLNSKILDGVFGVSFLGELPKGSFSLSTKTLTLTSGVGFIEDLPKLSLSITSKTLGLTIFKAITIDPRRVYKIK